MSTVSGFLTENKDGVVCHFTLSGTYTVNPDGTASINVMVNSSSTACVSRSAQELSILFQMGKGVAFVDSTTVLLGSLIKQ